MKDCDNLIVTGLIIGILFGGIISAYLVTLISYNKKNMNTLLIKEQCAKYNKHTGEFIIHNLLKKDKQNEN